MNLSTEFYARHLYYARYYLILFALARCESSMKRNWQDPTHKMYRCQFINVLASATSLKFVLAKYVQIFLSKTYFDSVTFPTAFFLVRHLGLPDLGLPDSKSISRIERVRINLVFLMNDEKLLLI